MYTNSNFKGLAALFIAVVLFVSCNSNESADATSDTAATTTYPSTDGAEQSMTPSDTTAVPESPDTIP